MDLTVSSATFSELELRNYAQPFELRLTTFADHFEMSLRHSSLGYASRSFPNSAVYGVLDTMAAFRA